MAEPKRAYAYTAQARKVVEVRQLQVASSSTQLEAASRLNIETVHVVRKRRVADRKTN